MKNEEEKKRKKFAFLINENKKKNFRFHSLVVAAAATESCNKIDDETAANVSCDSELTRGKKMSSLFNVICND